MEDLKKSINIKEDEEIKELFIVCSMAFIIGLYKYVRGSDEWLGLVLAGAVMTLVSFMLMF